MDNGKPWWMDDPELTALGERTLEELQRSIDKSEPVQSDEPDPVIADFYSGACKVALAAARDDLAGARARYQDAVVAARAAGLSWTEIGRLLVVSSQQLPRQFPVHPPN